MFASPITVEKAPETSPYRGRWLILNAGSRIADYVSEEMAQKEAKQVRVRLRFRKAYDRAEDRRVPFSGR